MCNIINVTVKCLLDIPTADAIYTVESVIDNNDNDITADCKLLCDNDCIRIDEKNIIVPCEYHNKNKSVTLSAYYCEEKYDFTIDFNSWNIVFEDDFSGNKLDETKWAHIPTKRIDHGFLSYYNKDRAFVKDGCLVSRAFDTGGAGNGGDANGKHVCLTGAVYTKGLFEHSYGYYEFKLLPHQVGGMRVRLSIVAGDMDKEGKACPNDGSAKYGVEIRIAELFRNFGINQGVYWDGYGDNRKSSIYRANVNHIDIFDGKYHKFGFRWSPDEYIFLVDDIITRRSKAGGICVENGYINIITECGTGVGNWVLNCGEYSDMFVDYVKVYSTNSDY